MDDKENNELNINPNPPEDNLVNPNPFIASSGTETKKEEETEKVEEASDEQASERVGEEVGETTDEQVGETAGEEVDKPAEETEKVETPVENKTEAPAFTANNLGANMASTTPFPEQGIPVAREKKPKKFLGLIIAIVAVLVLGGGAAAAYFVMHTPENLALSALMCGGMRQSAGRAKAIRLQSMNSGSWIMFSCLRIAPALLRMRFRIWMVRLKTSSRCPRAGSSPAWSIQVKDTERGKNDAEGKNRISAATQSGGFKGSCCLDQ